jgi:hypothetical protein
MNDSEAYDMEQIELEIGRRATDWKVPDTVNNPPHYTSHPSGIECIQITEHMGFCLGNAVKYIWRADEKHKDNGVEDIRKAIWYLNRELEKRTK